MREDEAEEGVGREKPISVQGFLLQYSFLLHDSHERKVSCSSPDGWMLYLELLWRQQEWWEGL